MRRTAALLALPLLLTAACADDGPQRSVAASTAASPAPSATAAPGPDPTDEPSASPTAAGDTGLKDSAPSGGPLTVVAVRAARQDGFDRVVFELAGREPGVPGYRVEYVDEPSRQGSGDLVQVDGDVALQVLVDGTGYPMDTGEEEASAATLGGDLEVVQDVELGAVFEGTYEAWIGLDRERPFTVTVLSDPARVVVDVQHP